MVDPAEGGGGGGGATWKSQVAIGFLKKNWYGTDTPRDKLLFEGGPYDPL